MTGINIRIFILISVFYFCAGINSLYSQGISFLSDYLGNVLVFDNGNLKQIEHLPLKSYKIGNKSFAYEDNAENFKIYHKNFVHKLTASVTNYEMSNNYVAYKVTSLLRLFDDGNILSLSNDVGDYFLSDDVAIWFDNTQKKLKAYSEKKFYDLDDALASDRSNEVLMGKNIAAYTDSRGYMNIFYKGEIIQLDYYDRIKSLVVGKDIVAFVEEPINSFQVFYKGEIIELDTFEPRSYKAGDSFLAYVDANNYLKVFSDFNTETVSFDNPDFYEVKDELLIFGVQNYFKVYYNGKTYTLESFIPSEYLFHNNVICYLDQLGNLKFFDGNKTETISYETLDFFELHGNIVKYAFGVSSENLYFNGRTYKND